MKLKNTLSVICGLILMLVMSGVPVSADVIVDYQYSGYDTKEKILIVGVPVLLLILYTTVMSVFMNKVIEKKKLAFCIFVIVSLSVILLVIFRKQIASVLNYILSIDYNESVLIAMLLTMLILLFLIPAVLITVKKKRATIKAIILFLVAFFLLVLSCEILWDALIDTYKIIVSRPSEPLPRYEWDEGSGVQFR